jgi:hypothetical protein
MYIIELFFNSYKKNILISRFFPFLLSDLSRKKKYLFVKVFNLPLNKIVMYYSESMIKDVFRDYFFFTFELLAISLF